MYICKILYPRHLSVHHQKVEDKCKKCGWGTFLLFHLALICYCML